MPNDSSAITFRSLQPDDFKTVTELFADWFPIHYDVDFRYSICHGESPYCTIAAIHPVHGVVGLVVYRYESGGTVEVCLCINYSFPIPFKG